MDIQKNTELPERDAAAVELFNSARKFMDVYQLFMQPLCEEAHMPPMALDILMYLANNPACSTARDVCRGRGFKPGIVSFHVDKLVWAGFLERREMPGDRRKTRLVCTEKARPIIEKGQEMQRDFALRLLRGVDDAEISELRSRLSLIDENLRAINNNTSTGGDTKNDQTV